MTALILALASFTMTNTVSNTHDYMLLRLECKKIEKGGIGTVTPCEYEYLVLKDSSGVEHKYKVKDIVDKSVKDLKNLEVKK